MSPTTLMVLIAVPFGVLMLSFIAMTVVAGRSVGASRRAPKDVAERPRILPLSPETYAEVTALIGEGKLIPAIKLVRKETGLGLKEAKDYTEAIRDGRVAPPAPIGPPGMLSDRVRGFLRAGDRDAAVALVQAETGMSRPEATRFVEALD
ncbi:50S ribosomal protein L7/L12 [Thermomonospora umbrina]|uniref:Ribosomal L7/L12-like protein n=1 Tax=Thermomonospora umbrina TaxID=111806 RepID=A0A3D9SSR3_9ACTN|nr:50S ribosomal protein L7/L12 [Thermomonospora umbrina]REE98647.1 ribosomal L7/L12-like protein [Thermomonospora umbrina]